MKVLGVTGGIGSGKSTVVNHLKKLGVPVFIADEQSKLLLKYDSNIRSAVKSLLGSQAYKQEDGQEVPDKRYMASKVFSDKDLLSALNSILHPAVRERFQKWKADQNAHYVAYEAAILLETGGRSICDQVLLITAPEELRVQRVLSRDDTNREEILNRMSKQSSELQKLLQSDIVISNINLTETLSELRYVHRFMLK